MNQVQIAIILVVAIIVLGIVAYYIYQENKFKKMIENNFNQAADDVIQQEKGLVFENQQEETNNKSQLFQKDKALASQPKLKQDEIGFDPLLDDDRLNDHSEENAFFAKYNQFEFPYKEMLNPELDHVIDIVMEKPVKIKALPDIAQFSNKKYTYFILEKGGNWTIYERSRKYVTEGIKLVINLVDLEGVVSDLQINNIYNELAKFSLHHNAHINQTDSELKIRKIQQQVKNLANVELELGLYVINKDEISFRHLAKYFDSNGFTNNNGVFEYKIENKAIFDIRDEDGKSFDSKGGYRSFSINSKLHHLENPMLAIEKIFDFAEHYMQYFESCLLTTNKMAMTERDYQSLEKQVVAYQNTSKRQGVPLGSDLLLRVLP